MTHRPHGAGLRRPDMVRGLVSVVIPAFNAEEWLADAIGSVRSQTYRAVETIVVDDGSRDGSASIATDLGATVVGTSNVGPGAARNAGMTVARGEFLQFLDSDDALAAEKIARQVAVLDASGADIAWEPYHDLTCGEGPNADFVLGAKRVPAIGNDLAASLLTTQGFLQVGAMLVRRSPRTDAVWFTSEKGAIEDVRYAMSLALSGARFVSSDDGQPGLLFRQHAGPRYSTTRPLVEFAKGCAANAVWAQERWEHDGGLTPARRAALGEAYAFAARQLAASDRAAFAEIAARGTELGADFTNRLPARVRWLSRIVGYDRAERIVTRLRAVKGNGLEREAGAGP